MDVPSVITLKPGYREVTMNTTWKNRRPAVISISRMALLNIAPPNRRRPFNNLELENPWHTPCLTTRNWFKVSHCELGLLRWPQQFSFAFGTKT